MQITFAFVLCCCWWCCCSRCCCSKLVCRQWCGKRCEAIQYLALHFSLCPSVSLLPLIKLLFSREWTHARARPMEQHDVQNEAIDAPHAEVVIELWGNRGNSLGELCHWRLQLRIITVEMIDWMAKRDHNRRDARQQSQIWAISFSINLSKRLKCIHFSKMS